MPRSPAAPVERRSATDRLWATQIIMDWAKNALPTTRNSVEVTIVGRPEAKLNNLYILAVSIAMGTIFDNRSGFTGFSTASTHGIHSEINYRRKTIKIVLGYSFEGTIEKAIDTATGVSGPGVVGKNINDPIYFGPVPDFLVNPFPLSKTGWKNNFPPIKQGIFNGTPYANQALMSTPTMGNPGLPDATNGAYGWGSDASSTGEGLLAGSVTVTPEAGMMEPAPLIFTCVQPDPAGQQAPLVTPKFTSLGSDTPGIGIPAPTLNVPAQVPPNNKTFNNSQIQAFLKKLLGF